MIPDRARLVRRDHAHFLVPSASFGEMQRKQFDTTLQPAGWVIEPNVASEMSVQWMRGRVRLRLQTLGWFPLLVTVGPLGRITRVHRDAVARLTAVVQTAGGKSLTDRQLADYLPQAQLRWQRALLERRRLTQAERVLDGRQCARCGLWSEGAATHCVSCRHRFTAVEDAERDEEAGRASATIEAAERALADLARGVLLERLDEPTLMVTRD